MEKKHYAQTLNALNGIGAAWSAQFDHKPQLEASFTADGAGKLSINGEPLCLVSQIDPESIFIGVESFGFLTKSGAEYRIYIDWPFEGKPRVHRVAYDFFGREIAN